MNVDEILKQLNDEGVDYILIGGMNFLLRHIPELTFDVDIWVKDTPANLGRTNRALQRLGAAWGPSETDWNPVPHDSSWLQERAVFCLTTNHGALNIFREVRGLEGRYEECKRTALQSETAAHIPFLGLSDVHMLIREELIPLSVQNVRRKDFLTNSIAGLASARSTGESPGVKRAEEEKRDRAYDPAQRWRHIQETITWAEANLPPEKQRNRPRRHPSNRLCGRDEAK